MMLDAATCYRAAKAHDSRFDGRFFTAVSSTRIYCRPICPVKTPKRENCRFFPSAAGAEAAGYRPCMRCRPELAPGNSSVDASHRIAQAAASLIEDGTLSDGGLDEMAERLGVTDRHLRRVFHEEFGVSPVEFAQTQRLLLAKRLLTDTRSPVTEVAYASGFGSLRRFNALFKSRYRMCPGQLRKVPLRHDTLGAHSFELSYRPPYDWDATAAFLKTRSIAGVEQVERYSYRRTVRITRDGTHHTGWIEVAPHRIKPAMRVVVSASLVKVIPAVLARVKNLLDLSCNPAEVAEALGTLAARNPGVRVPGAFDGFEIAVRAILGQQITVAAARTLTGRFAAAFGVAVASPFEPLATAFPSPEEIACKNVDQIARLGIIAARARAIIALAGALARNQLTLSAHVDVESTMEQMRAMPGIGEWTAQYIAMRALGWPDAFPHTDYAVMKALGEKNPRRVLAAGEAWRPWRSYAVMHLWRSLKEPSTK